MLRLSLFGLALTLSTSIGCTHRAAEPEVVASPTPMIDSTMDWGAKLFPNEPAPAPRASSDAAPTAREPEPEPAPIAPSGFWAPTDLMVEDGEIAPEHTSAAALCRAYSAIPTEPDPDFGPPAPRACSEVKLPFEFKATKRYLGVIALRFFDGYAESFSLYVELEAGLAWTGASWGYDDRGFPGCPSVARMRALEQVRVDRGVLVIVLLGEDNGVDDDGNYRLRLTPQVMAAKPDKEGTLHYRVFPSRWKGGPFLGEKFQPGEVTEPRTPWAKVAWRGRREFSVSRDGRLLFPD
ncbi:MAG: hypothetical protein U0271_08425 [Polyangiaceae bacterium]